MQITWYKASIAKRCRLSKRDRFCKRKTTYSLMEVYVTGLNALDNQNFKIDIIGFAYAIIIFSAIERLASIRE